MIDLIEILKDVPQGTELRCLLFKDPVTFHTVNTSALYPISVKTSVGELVFFTKEGYYSSATAPQNCMLYPPMKNSWDNVEYIPDGKLVIYERNGKIVQIGCAKGGFAYIRINVYWWYDLESHTLYGSNPFYFSRQATEEEKSLFFNSLTEAGYALDGNEVVPLFKKGDIIASENTISIVDHVAKLGSIENVIYYQACIDSLGKLHVKTDSGVGTVERNHLAGRIEKQRILRMLDEAGYEFDGVNVKPKQITFKHFEPVIVRDNSNQRWVGDFFQYMEGNVFVCSGSSWHFCLPYNDDTKHLIGTSMPAPKYYR